MNMEGIKLSGLWKNKTKDGKTYLSGNLGTAKMLVLPNDFKRAGGRQRASKSGKGITAIKPA
jgi:hypothetical protein